MQVVGFCFGEKYDALGWFTPVSVLLYVVPTQLFLENPVTHPFTPQETHPIEEVIWQPPHASHRTEREPLTQRTLLYDLNPIQPLSAGNLVKSCSVMFCTSVLGIAISRPL